MFFSNLRANSQLFILHKDSTPYVEMACVTNVTAPMPTFGALGQPTQYTVDISARVGEQAMTFQKLPANAEVADFAGNGNVVLTSTREAMNTEVQAMRERSSEILKSVEYHKNVINVCDKILETLNPEFAEKAQQQKELNDLKQQFVSMTENLNNLMEMNKELLSQLKGEKTSRKKGEKCYDDN